MTDSEEVYHLMDGEKIVGLLNLSEMTFNINGDYTGELPVYLYPEGSTDIYPTQYNVSQFIISRAIGQTDYISSLIAIEQTEGKLPEDELHLVRITLAEYKTYYKEEEEKWTIERLLRQ